MNETILRRALLVIAILGLALGIGVWRTGLGSLRADTIWTVATLPVVVALAISILRDFWIGRFGVDVIALVSMSAAAVTAAGGVGMAVSTVVSLVVSMVALMRQHSPTASRPAGPRP